MGPWEAGLKGQSLANPAAMQVWKYTPSIMRRALEQTHVPPARTSDFQKIEDMWRTDVAKWFEEADKAALSGQHAIDAAVRTFRQVYLHRTDAHMEDMRLNTQSWGFDVGDVDHEGIKLWCGDRDENTPVRMGRFMAERLRGSGLRVYEGKSHNPIWGQESVREFVADLLSRAGLR